MPTLPQTRGCFCCGVHNTKGLQLGFTHEQQQVEARFQFQAEHCGFPAVVHGGLISTVLDETMAWVIGVNARQFAYCAELKVRFLRPAIPGVDLVVRGELVANKRDRLYLARAELRNEAGELLAEGEGKFMPLPASAQQAMRTEFIEDPTPILGPAPGGEGEDQDFRSSQDYY
jgi:uncharacterized protein (TIGR00369 family)